MVHREGVGENAAAADPAVARLDAGEAAERRRPAHRAAGVGADRTRRKPRRHRCPGAAGRPARQPPTVPWVERWRPRQIKTRTSEREFPGRELAEQYTA